MLIKVSHDVQGLLANIGVSNFGIHHLEKLMQTAKVVPAVNQVGAILRTVRHVLVSGHAAISKI